MDKLRGMILMMIYPIGTVVTLVDGEQQLMITARFPLYENQGEYPSFYCCNEGHNDKSRIRSINKAN